MDGDDGDDSSMDNRGDVINNNNLVKRCKREGADDGVPLSPLRLDHDDEYLGHRNRPDEPDDEDPRQSGADDDEVRKI